MTANVRVGLIGSGDHARHALADAIGRMSGWSIVAVADPSADARQRISASLPHAQLYETHQTLLSEMSGLDLIIVATPPAASVSVVQAAWVTNAAILMEKPAALHSSELDQLPGRVAPVSCAYGYRFHPTVTSFQERLGDLGALETMELRFNAPIDVMGTWRAKREMGGGALRDLGAHLLDLASGLLPAPLVLEQATIRSTRTDDDEATVEYQAETVRLRISCAYQGAPEFSMHATGAGGSLRADLWSMTTPARGLAGAVASRVRSKLPGELRPSNALRRSRMTMLSAAVTPSSSPSPASVRDAVLVLQLIEAAEAASR